MELTLPLRTSISVRKRQLEPEEEELELPDEFKPLAVSTPNVSSYTVPDILVVYITTGMKRARVCVCVCVCVCVR